jgi:membrane-bound acyltransferase YfiQ involved in biofilm formation
MNTPLGLLPLAIALVAEVLITQPRPYEMYVMTKHGFFLGMIAFFFGFCFVLSGEGFWKMIVRWRWPFVMAGLSLYFLRIFGLNFEETLKFGLLPVETISWVLVVLSFSHLYLNRPSNALNYLSEAVYPVYILHMIFLYLASVLIFPLQINVQLQYLLTLVFTLAGCFGTYEIIRRIKYARVLFGLKMK